MKHRISAGMLLLDEQDRIALVRYTKEDQYDFWVAPGGGIEPGEGLIEAAHREVQEEISLSASGGKLVAIEQLIGSASQTHFVKHWFFARISDAKPLVLDKKHADAEGIVEARWCSRSELVGKTVFPPILELEFWHALEQGFPAVMILPIRTMAFE